jgi:serine/threonine protein kinase
MISSNSSININSKSLTIIRNISINNICQISECRDENKNKILCRKRYKDEDKLIAYNEIFINERLTNNKNKNKFTPCKNIVKYYGYYINPDDNYSINLLFEYSKYGNLFDYLINNYTLPFSENLNNNLPLIRDIIMSVIESLIYIHKIGVIHNDIKMENILVFKKSGRIILKLCDFNNSKIISSIKQNVFNSCISVYNSKPIFLFEEPSFGTDYWLLGCFIYQIIFWQEINVNLSFDKFFTEIKLLEVELELKIELELELKNLIQGLLEFNKEKRLKGRNIIKHPFFKKIRGKKIFTAMVKKIKLFRLKFLYIQIKNQIRLCKKRRKYIN